LKKLEVKGYIERSRSNVHERNLVITLTKNGEELKDKILSVPVVMGKCINLGTEEAKQLYPLMYKVLKNVEDDKEEE
jgi:DNA-binding MarR family transcriptional regulator